MIKVYQIYNQQRSMFGGEENVINMIASLVSKNGGESKLIMKTSRGIEKSFIKKFCAFWGGIYNYPAYIEMRNLLKKDPPDVVHAHGVYPLFSPSVLVACREVNVPVVMTVHSHILTCPTWYHLCHGKICEQCVGGHEYQCILNNCRENILESLGYALRSIVARKFRLFHDNVSMIIVLTEFAKSKLLNAGFCEANIAVVNNAISIPAVAADPISGEYIAFAGRLSHEKGVDTLLAASSLIPHVPIRIAGDGPMVMELKRVAPKNVSFVGLLDSDSLNMFYKKSRFVVVPSKGFENLSIVAIEAMGHGLPVIAAKIGGLPEIIEDGVTGLLFEPSNPEDLARKMTVLWENPDLCREMGMAGREKAIRKYNKDDYYQKLISVYDKAIKMKHL